ncbi:hypothetical protein DFO62_12945 [Serratia fonticola]|nr:hypothetical protein DFO62_12945 [Serratia fonticola]
MEKRRLPGKTAKCSVLSGLALAALLSPVAQAAMGLRLTDDSRRDVVPGVGRTAAVADTWQQRTDLLYRAGAYRGAATSWRISGPYQLQAEL